MLSVRLASGQLLEVPWELLRDARSLKQQLQHASGLPRFRQRLLYQDAVLEDPEILVESMSELQLVVLPFCSASVQQKAALVDAAELGSISEVEEILQRPQHPDSEEGMTALGMASFKGKAEIVSLLLEAKADKDKACGFRGATPLVLASTMGHEKVVQLLLAAGADKDNACNANADGIDRCQVTTPLGMASKIGYVKVACLLLRARADTDKVCATDTDQFTTPLGVACFEGHAELVRVLLDAGASTNQEFGPNNTTPLGVASGDSSRSAAHQNMELALQLMRAGHQVDLSEFSDCHVEIVRMLLEAGANKNMPFGPHGLTPLGEAISHRRVDIVKLLLAASTDVNQVFGPGSKSPLGVACNSSHVEAVEIVRSLLEARANAEVSGFPGATPLELASSRGQLSVVRLLLAAGAGRSSSGGAAGCFSSALKHVAIALCSKIGC